MGRAFEFRKERKMKRWGHMARTFTKLGKEITVAVKQGGPDVTVYPRLRALIAEARTEQMPKENIERAIKKATESKQGDFKEVVYEGYGPFGIAYLVETATDNTTRTVANVRSYFTKCGGTLGTSGSVSFMFDHKCVFRIKSKEGVDLEELELELIDYGVDELFEEEVEDKDGNISKEICIYGDYTSYGTIQKYIEDNGYELVSGGFERIPTTELKEVTPEQRATLDKLTGLLEDDEDVTNVYTALKPEESAGLDCPSRICPETFFENVQGFFHFRHFQHIGYAHLIDAFARSLVEGAHRGHHCGFPFDAELGEQPFAEGLCIIHRKLRHCIEGSVRHRRINPFHLIEPCNGEVAPAYVFLPYLSEIFIRRVESRDGGILAQPRRA